MVPLKQLSSFFGSISIGAEHEHLGNTRDVIHRFLMQKKKRKFISFGEGKKIIPFTLKVQLELVVFQQKKEDAILKIDVITRCQSSILY